MVEPNPARRRLAAVSAVGLASALALTACSGGAGSSSSVGYVDIDPGIAQVKTPDRQTMPQLSGTTLEGKAYKSSYSGHVTVVNVWGSWCTQCREEAAAFAETSAQYAAKGVQFIGIDTLDQNAGGMAYQSQFGVEYPSLQDPDESLLLTLKSIIPSEGVPSTVIVDSSGKVAVRAIGAITEPELKQELNYALSES